MKYLFILLTLLPLSANAQTLVSKEQANTYYNSCSTQPSAQKFIGNGQQAMCACQAARMTQFFYAEDMKAMMSKNPVVARPAYNKMIVNVYAPCMGEPTRAYHYNECIKNPQVSAVGDPQYICTCSSNALAMHMERHGSEIFSAILAHDPNAQDPMTALFSDKGFQDLAQTKIMDCLK